MSQRNQICQILKEFWPNFNASENDFKNPTQNFVMRFYESFFEEFALAQVLNEPIPTEKICNQDKIKESLPIISTCVFLKNIFTPLKGPHFMLEDIIEPNAKRTSKLIEMLTNFLAYVDCYSGPHSNKALTDCDDKVVEKQELQKERNELIEKLNECAMNKAKLTSKLKEIEENRMKLTPLNEGICINKAEKDDELALLEKYISDQKDELKSLELWNQKEMEEIQEIQEKIVSSPDAVSRERAELIIKKSDLDSEHLCALNSAKEKNRIESCLEQLIIVIQSKNAQVKDLLSQLNFSRELEAGLKIDETNWKNAKENLDAVLKEMQLKEQEINHLDVEKVKFEKKCNECRYALEKALEEVQRNKVERKEEVNKQGSKQKLVAEEIEQIKENIKSIEQEEDEFTKYIKDTAEHIYELVTCFGNNTTLQVETLKQRYSS